MNKYVFYYLTPPNHFPNYFDELRECYTHYKICTIVMIYIRHFNGIWPRVYKHQTHFKMHYKTFSFSNQHNEEMR